MSEEIEYEDVQDEEFSTIQKFFAHTGNYITIQQSINRGFYNSLFQKIEDKEDDILVDFFVNSYYIFTNLKEEKLIIKSKSGINNIYTYCEKYTSFLFFDHNIDVISGYVFEKEYKEKYINTIKLSILKIVSLSKHFDNQKFNVDMIDFYFKVINLIIYKPKECKKVINIYNLKRTKRFKFSTHITELNKKNILKNLF